MSSLSSRVFTDTLQDDRKSLVELHKYLHAEEAESPTDEVELLVDPHSPTSLRSDRRLSLPSSILSISTADITWANTEAKPEANDFQLRRRRAAKLAQFFGVDYRSVMQEVLESIEKGVEDERQSGALQPEEAEVCSPSVTPCHRVLTTYLYP